MTRIVRWALAGALIVSLPVAVTACGKQEKSMEQSGGPAADITPSEQRADFTEKTAGRLGDLEDRIDALQEDVDKLPPDPQAVYTDRLDKLDARLQALTERADTLSEAPDSTWVEQMTGVDSTLTALEKDVETVARDVDQAKSR